MIYDIHCHILPGVDDGARNEESTLRMMNIAAENGITSIVATPHYVCGSEVEKTKDIIEKYEQIRKMWKDRSDKNELYLGNELYYGEELVKDLDAGRALTMNGTKYILVEFPVYIDFNSVRRAVQTLMYAGYWPILAHIERYECLRKRAHVSELVDMGAYMQVNADSVLGMNGVMIKHNIMKLLKDKETLIHFVATDSHNSKFRKPEISDCADYLMKKLGLSRTKELLMGNPRKMLKGERLDD